MDQKEIKELIRTFDKSGLNKLKIKNGDFEIQLQKGFPSAVAVEKEPTPTEAVAIQPTATPNEILKNEDAPSKSEDADYIKSPMVGTFYIAPSPGATPFVTVGDKVKAGNTVAIIEAMKIMNEIEAEFDCEIIEVLANDGEPVEFDQPLFKIKKI